MEPRETRYIIDKLSAARRQLNTAIQLWFEERDPVAIAGLTFAAREIFHAMQKKIQKKTGKKRSFPDPMPDEDGLSNSERSARNKIIRSTANFFKHANADPEAIHEFGSEVTMVFMLESIALYGDVTNGDQTGWMKSFRAFLLTARPRLFKPDLLEYLREVCPPDMLRQRNRTEFLKECCAGLPKCDPFIPPTEILPFPIPREIGPFI